MAYTEKRIGLAGVLLGLLVAASVAATTVPVEAYGPTYALIDIDTIGLDALTGLQGDEALIWWIEADDKLLVLADRADLDLLARRWTVELLELPVAPRRLAIVNQARVDVAAELGPGVDLLVRAGRLAVVQARPGTRDLPPRAPLDSLAQHVRVLEFEPNTILARQWANSRGRAASSPEPPSPLIEGFLNYLDVDRWFSDVTALAGFNRYTHGPEIHDARDWLVGEFSALPGLQVTTQAFDVDGTTAYNVIATWTGTTTPDEWYIVGAHYDSISEDPLVAAPGAEDNATGCAGVLELARVLTSLEPPSTVLFICYSGEEDGIRGSHKHANWLVNTGNDEKVRAMLNMDMIGFTEDPDLDCLIETVTEYDYLLDTFGQAAENHTSLRILTSMFPHVSDHLPYLTHDMPAMLAIENDWSSYPYYHSTQDTPEHVSLEMGGEILRMNAAALFGLTGIVDTGPIFSDGFESGDASAWTAMIQ